MCGVAGIFAYHYAALEVNRQELRQMRDHMANRGPDGLGEWYSQDARVGLGHRRLAILDLSEKASQPMQNQDGKVIISYNGEIYNYRELRADLEKKGRVFRSHSDTEVLLHLYSIKGEAMVHDLRGMFAFILWDSQKKVMLLARDPYGIKPLYYADDGWTVRAASQVKALLQSEKVSKLPESAGIVGFFLLGSIPEPYTLYQEIRAVPAGSTVLVDETGPHEAKTYFSISEIFSEADNHSKVAKRSERLSAPAVIEALRHSLQDSLQHHFVSDVPVGLFLSGGIDSSVLLGIAHDLGIRGIKTITLAFEEFKGTEQDEAPYAEEVSRFYGSDHHTRVITKQEFEAELPKIYEAMDQPSIDGINTYFVSKAAREIGLKVTLSGLGADELFGGYSSYRQIPLLVNLLCIPSRVPFLGDLSRHLLFAICHWLPSVSPKIPGLLKYGGNYAGAYYLKRGLFMPWELKAVLKKDLIDDGLQRFRLLEYILETGLNPNPQSPYARIASLESNLYMKNQLLRDADWAGMAHSIEIRVPYIDVELWKSAMPMISQNANSSWKEILAEIPSVGIPDHIRRRSKQGFNVPFDYWIGGTNVGKSNGAWSRKWASDVIHQFTGVTAN